MSTEWEKIERKPEKMYKVHGLVLLEFKQKIKTHEEKISELTKNRKELDSKIDGLEKDVSNLEDRIKEKDANITSLEENIAELKDSLSKKEAEISKINEEKTTEIAKIQEEQGTGIAKIKEEKDAEIAAVKKDVTEKASKDEAEIKNLSNQIEKMLSDIEAKDNSITDKDAEIGELNKEIDNLNVKIEELKEQIPKKPVYEEADETIKGASCPKCGWTTLEDYKIIDGKKKLIRKHCPNTFCMWSSAEEVQKITYSMADKGPEEEVPDLIVYQVKGGEIEETKALASSMVALVADNVQNIVWIWKGNESSRFEYAEATRQATNVKNDIVTKPNTQVVRVNEGEEPDNFPNIGN